ncbi:9748_t:CDS:2 [Cetraspora pellucida]|uniref:9748_t:CDS:1 n=1 Tax=Cetraspora pellucida TaxID=1433469 RepID=A0A9N9AHX4_9GLOM|nr:9748_t:CDS:2 [Cetraspora pellucida]
MSSNKWKTAIKTTLILYFKNDSEYVLYKLFGSHLQEKIIFDKSRPPIVEEIFKEIFEKKESNRLKKNIENIVNNGSNGMKVAAKQLLSSFKESFIRFSIVISFREDLYD